MPHVFISYSSKNQEYVRKLAQHIRERGFDVWMDDRIDYGEDWWEAIVQAIAECAAFIVVMSPDAEQSEWVRKEILNAKRGARPIFPLLLDGREFTILIDTQYVDVTGENLPPDDFYERLRVVIEPADYTGENVSPHPVGALEAYTSKMMIFPTSADCNDDNAIPPLPKLKLNKNVWNPTTIIAALGLLIAFLVFLFGDGILNRNSDETPPTAESTLTDTPQTPTITPTPTDEPVRTATPAETTVPPDSSEVFVPGDIYDEMGEVDAFYIDRYEVIRRDFADFYDAHFWDLSPEATNRLRPIINRNEDLPMRNVRYDEARDYCRWVGGELPTREQWLVAAGLDPDTGIIDLSINDDTGNIGGLSASVMRGGAFPPNALGLYDMIGNVSEWTLFNAWSGRSYIMGGSHWSPVFSEVNDLTLIIVDVDDANIRETGFRCVYPAGE